MVPWVFLIVRNSYICMYIVRDTDMMIYTHTQEDTRDTWYRAHFVWVKHIVRGSYIRIHIVRDTNIMIFTHTHNTYDTGELLYTCASAPAHAQCRQQEDVRAHTHAHTPTHHIAEQGLPPTFWTSECPCPLACTCAGARAGSASASTSIPMFICIFRAVALSLYFAIIPQKIRIYNPPSYIYKHICNSFVRAYIPSIPSTLQKKYV